MIECDVVVVGMGPGGEEVAGSLAVAGLDVVGVERELLGGECPYWGCIPSKMMIRAANLLTEGHRIDGMAGHADVTPDFAPVATRIRDEATTDWNDKIAVDRFTGKGGRFVRGVGRLTGPGEVQVDSGGFGQSGSGSSSGGSGGGQVFRARRGVVLATGAAPVIPPIDGLAGTPYWTNREALENDVLPSSLIVLGGGAIGVELAQAYARFGVATTVVEAADRLIPLEEPESSRLLEEVLEKEGLAVRTGNAATTVSHDGSAFTVQLSDGSAVSAERLLVSVGRRPRLRDLGLETVGLDPNARGIETDGQMRAGERLWAVGDLTVHGGFTHMSMYQARIATRDILGVPGPPAAYHAVPRVTFTDPEIGSVGLSEAEARDQGLSVRTGSAQVPSTARGWIHKAGNEGLIKLVAADGALVGATSAGPVGGEVLGLLVLAVHARVPVDELRTMIYAYPTFHRGIEDALTDLGA